LSYASFYGILFRDPHIMGIFGNLSGLRLNRNKTEGIWLGRLKHCKDKFENITCTKDIFISLRVHFGHDISRNCTDWSYIGYVWKE
jgi:hypothetical protein